MKKNTYLIANGDLRLAANQICQMAQSAMEDKIASAVQKEGWTIRRGHPFDKAKGHGFIDSQKYGIEVFRKIPCDVPIIVAEAVWQYSQHILPGLFAHKGPILTLANWSGTWSGLVGTLNLNASLTKAGVKYSTLWSENFDDPFFLNGLRAWLKTGEIKHDISHVRPLVAAEIPAIASRIGVKVAEKIRKEKAILGVFDEGCMGMYNAIIPDELLQPLGLYKERLSQSALYAKMQTVSDKETLAIYEWYLKKGLKFHFSRKEDFTKTQVLEQCRMYIAVIRMADEFGCSAIGIQYQQGLKDLTPASDLVEGTLNNCERPPVRHEITGKILFSGEALPHFNEVDECAGLDGLITYQIWKELGLQPENTLHDLRFGRRYSGGGIDDFVWVFLISGAAPPAHFIRGWSGADSLRQPKMFFHLGGGTLRGISKPGWIVWSRVYVDSGKLSFDTGLAEVVKLPREETEERWRLTTPQWPIMHAILPGITRDQMMAQHKSNHIQVAYAFNKASARKALYAKAAAMQRLGLKVFLCGTI